jgi:hypothetical protein
MMPFRSDGGISGTLYAALLRLNSTFKGQVLGPLRQGCAAARWPAFWFGAANATRHQPKIDGFGARRRSNLVTVGVRATAAVEALAAFTSPLTR